MDGTGRERREPDRDCDLVDVTRLSLADVLLSDDWVLSYALRRIRSEIAGGDEEIVAGHSESL